MIIDWHQKEYELRFGCWYRNLILTSSLMEVWHKTSLDLFCCYFCYDMFNCYQTCLTHSLHRCVNTHVCGTQPLLLGFVSFHFFFFWFLFFLVCLKVCVCMFYLFLALTLLFCFVHFISLIGRELGEEGIWNRKFIYLEGESYKYFAWLQYYILLLLY